MSFFAGYIYVILNKPFFPFKTLRMLTRKSLDPDVKYYILCLEREVFLIKLSNLRLQLSHVLLNIRITRLELRSKLRRIMLKRRCKFKV